MSHIQNIEIKNFKSIRHQTIDDCRRVNVFIGYPNVGKSNILEALGLFSIDEMSHNFDFFVRSENLTTLFYDGDINHQLEVRINGKHRYIGEFAGDTVIFNQQFEREGTFFEKYDSKTSFLDESNEVSKKKHFKLSQSKKSILDFSSNSIGRQNELPEIKKYQFLKLVRYTNNGYSSLSHPFGDNIFNIVSTNKILKKEVSELFEPYNLELLYDTREQKFSIFKRTAFGIFSIPYELVADTLQRLIFYKTAILSNKEKVLVFEEPEAHMFPPYTAKFTSDIMYDENANQFFIATHSPYVVNDFMENLEKEDYSIYTIAYEKETGETLIRKLVDEELDEIYQYGVDLFLNLENYLPHVQQQ